MDEIEVLWRKTKLEASKNGRSWKSAMVILSIIHLPMVIINSFGESAKLGTASVAITTVGNLGAAQNISTGF
jgi:hypothetical protein